jgi:hypothetical protein
MLVDQCYFVSYQGCIYQVYAPVNVPTCPPSTYIYPKNVGQYVGTFQTPEDGCCTVDAFYKVNEPWNGWFACGSTFTVNINWPTVYYDNKLLNCAGDLDCGKPADCVTVFPCGTRRPLLYSAAVGSVGSQTFHGVVQMNYGPQAVMLNSQLCNSTPAAACNCNTGTVYVGSSPSATNYGSNCNTQYPNQVCCIDGQGRPNKVSTCGVTMSWGRDYSRNFVTSLTLTRSCPATSNYWANIVSNQVIIDGCVFEVNARASTLASQINLILKDLVTASGNSAWIGTACPKYSNACNNCLPDQPYEWQLASSTPTSVVFEARPILSAYVTISFGSQPGCAYSCDYGTISPLVCNSTEPNNHLIGASWQSANGLFAEYGVPVTMSMFALTLQSESRSTGNNCYPISQQNGQNAILG